MLVVFGTSGRRFHTFQIQTLAPRHSSPAPCTGCLVLANAIAIPEGRLEVVRDTHGQPCGGRPCSRNVPGPRRGGVPRVPCPARDTFSKEQVASAPGAHSRLMVVRHHSRVSPKNLNPRSAAYGDIYWEQLAARNTRRPRRLRQVGCITALQKPACCIALNDITGTF